MKRSPTADDPRHFTTRDGRTMPVTGTHAPDELCSVCQTTPLRKLATAFPLGAFVRWPYGGSGGHAHGRVIAQGRTRLQVFWHARRPRPTWIAAARLERVVGLDRPRGCQSCEAGR